MSEQLAGETIPDWDYADRMRKALRYAGITPGQMADYLHVGRNTVSTWINGRIRPSAQTLRLWALRTGVPFDWLACHGDPGRPCELRPLAAPGTGGNSGRPRINMHLYLSRKDYGEVA